MLNREHFDVLRPQLLQEFHQANEQDSVSHLHVAAFLDCSPWTLQKQRVDGSPMPFTKIGRSVAYVKADVIAYRDSKKCTNTAQYKKAS